MANFYFRSTKERVDSVLYVRVVRPKFKINWEIKTQIVVNVKAWNKAQTSAKELAKFYSTKEGAEIQEKMRIVEQTINEYLSDSDFCANPNSKFLARKIAELVGAEKARAELSAVEIKKARAKEKQERKQRELESIVNYYDDFLIRIESGAIRQGKNNSMYRDTSVSVWRTFGKYLKGYLESISWQGMTFREITKSFADGFTNYLEDCGLMMTTRNQQINCFRRLCNSAVEDMINNNIVSLKVWKSRTEDDEEKRAEIVLSEEEINALYDMKLSGQQAQVRDIWLLGYFSAQRVSDYSTFTADNFVEIGGYEAIRVLQRKTGKEVYIPIEDKRVKEICKKYNYSFPKLTRDTINRVIKQIAEVLSYDVPTLREWHRTLLGLKERNKEQRFLEMKKRIESGEKLHGEESKQYKKMLEYAISHDSGDMLFKRDFAGHVIRQRWELLTCHTTRRTRITELYESRVLSMKQIMSISGHSTLKNAERYLKVDKLEQFQRTAKALEAHKNAKEIPLKKEIL